MRPVRRIAGTLTVATLLAIFALMLFAMLKGRPQDLPWTPLSLAEQPGLFTGRKLAGLTDDAPHCRALLDEAGVRFTRAPAVSAGPCGYADGVRFATGGARRIAFAPAVTTSCPVAAALAMWEWNVIQPAARRYLGQPVTQIEHFGSYSCRRMYGRATGGFSEHATADAIDVAAFRLADGTRVSVLKDWADTGDKGTFLRAVRKGGCGLFSTVLSPDYNAAHRDHLHLDQAARGAMGWRACR